MMFKVPNNFAMAAMMMQRLEKEAMSEVNKELEGVVKKILKLARKRAPVKTGALKATGRYYTEKKSKKEVTFRIVFGSAEVYYAYWQEVGTQYFGGRFYLTSAVRTYKSEVLKCTKKGVQKSWDSAVGPVSAAGAIVASV